MQQRQPELPDLRVVPVADLLLHEQHDAQRSEPLLQRLRVDGVLKNPPIVAPIRGEQRYVVLDGANRVTATRSIGLAHIVVQVVDYEDPELLLDTWHHLVSGLSSALFRDTLCALKGVQFEPAELLHAQAQLDRREVLAVIQYPQAQAWTVHAGGDLHERTQHLNDIVDLYKLHGRIFRANSNHLATLLPYHDDIALFGLFAPSTLEEIVDLARVGACLPAGITRHLIPRRALRINLPLELLASDETLEQKNAWLALWIRQKVTSKAARYYQESTFLFDE